MIESILNLISTIFYQVLYMSIIGSIFGLTYYFIRSVFDKSFMEDFDSYVLDQFVMRFSFRNIKARVSYNVFGKLDNNGIFVNNGYIFKSEYPTDVK